MKEHYYNGFQIEYTGNSEIVYGSRFFEVKYLEGYLAGTTRVTSKCPDCGLQFGQDQPANNVCTTCSI